MEGSAGHPAGHIAAPEGSDPPAAAHDPEKDMREFAELDKRLKAIKAEEKEIRPRHSQLQERILQDMVDRGIRSVELEGLGKIGIRKERWAKVKRRGEEATAEEKAAAVAALEAAGLGDYVEPTYNLRTISALFRSWQDEGSDPPPELEAAWEADDRHKVVLYSPTNG